MLKAIILHVSILRYKLITFSKNKVKIIIYYRNCEIYKIYALISLWINLYQNSMIMLDIFYFLELH